MLAADPAKVPLGFESFTTQFFYRTDVRITHIIWTSIHEAKLGFGTWLSSDCTNLFPSIMFHG